MPSVLLDKVLDSEKNDKRIGSFTPEVAHMVLGIKKNQVPVYANEKRRYKKRYLFVAEPPEPGEYDVYADWDATVKRLREMAGGGKHGD